MSVSFRARFPDKPPLTITHPSNAPFSTVLTQLQTHLQLTQAPIIRSIGPPPVVLNPSPNSALSEVLKSGDVIIVEPSQSQRQTQGISRRRRGILKPSRERPRASRGGKTPGGASNTVSLKDFRKPSQASTADHDDPNDADWSEEMENDVRPKRRNPRKNARKAYTLGSDAVPSQQVNLPRLKKKAPDDIVRVAARNRLNGQDVQGLLAGAVVNALSTKSEDLDLSGKKFKESLNSMLKLRMAEAEGEKRVEAVLSGNYSFVEETEYFFRVKYKGLHCRTWKVEDQIMKVPREVLAAVYEQVVNGDDVGSKENCRMRNMAVFSVRSFWNMVKLFGKDVEGGLKELVPTADWTYLESRKRKRSVKGERNEQNKRDMKWTSD